MSCAVLLPALALLPSTAVPPGRECLIVHMVSGCRGRRYFVQVVGIGSLSNNPAMSLLSPLVPTRIVSWTGSCVCTCHLRSLVSVDVSGLLQTTRQCSHMRWYVPAGADTGGTYGGVTIDGFGDMRQTRSSLDPCRGRSYRAFVVGDNSYTRRGVMLTIGIIQSVHG
ncbi:hypothetical protein F5883DRAFT_47159 [Diaporthe sp. PMI_573]|nr:hypothetical protein F5883DRAFT_47159 [Diaporthaceae sp. PMI_573]